VTKVRFVGRRATGVEFVRRGRTHHVEAGREVVLSLGAINTPKLLMLSGVGERASLATHRLDVVQHLPGVGQNLQDHILLAGCCWEYQSPEPPRNNAAEFVFYTKSRADLPAPDLMPVLEEAPFASSEVARRYDVPQGAATAWTLAPGLAQPTSRGRVRLTSANALDAPLIEANFLSTEEDLRAMLHCVSLCREIGNSEICAPFRRREVFPGALNKHDMVRFIRQAAGTYFHQSCTARMGTDDLAVVDGSLRVHGLDALRVADASVMPTITRGNTMAPTALIAERAALLIRSAHSLSG
jgi:choline dehydrogenase